MTAAQTKSALQRGNQIWFNGKILPEEQARISIFTHALHYGIGIFEGIRAYKQKDGSGAIFRLQEHIDRFFESAKILDIRLPYTPEEVSRACIEACQANHFSECYIRPVAYIGDGPLGIHPGANPPIDVAVLTWVWPSYLSAESVEKGSRLKVSSYVRAHVNNLMTKGKITGQYVNSVLAKREATDLGYDEALMLDSEGYLTEGTGANLFIIKDGVVKTTPLNSILNGITRQSIITLLEKEGLKVQEVRFTRDELWCADEIFLTGTAAEVTPVREVDGREIGKGATLGKVGPITAKVKKDYQAIARGEIKPEFAQKWLTPFRCE